MMHDREGWKPRLVLTGAIVLGFSLVCSAGYQPAYTTMIENGPSANRIDMVFMGSTGKKAVDRFLMGSVSSAMARRCPVPVTIVR